MRKTFIRTTLAATVAAAALAMGALVGPAHALTVQQVIVSFDPTPDDPFNNDEVRDDERIDDSSGPIDRSILASINDPDGRFSGQGSVGEFGNLGVFGGLGRTGAFDTQIFIENDDFQNISGKAQQASLQFVIDGGSFFMIAGQDSVIDFALTVRKDFFPVYQSGFEYRSTTPFGGNNQLTTFGADLDLQTNNPFELEMPVNFETVDLGIIQPNEQFAISYQLDITVTGVDFVEVLGFEFSDPFAVSGFGEFPTVSFSDAPQAVPLPATAPLAAAAIGMLVLARRRRRR